MLKKFNKFNFGWWENASSPSANQQRHKQLLPHSSLLPSPLHTTLLSSNIITINHNTSNRRQNYDNDRDLRRNVSQTHFEYIFLFRFFLLLYWLFTGRLWISTYYYLPTLTSIVRQKLGTKKGSVSFFFHFCFNFISLTCFKHYWVVTRHHHHARSQTEGGVFVQHSRWPPLYRSKNIFSLISFLLISSLDVL
jgi:hypothetical protein